MLKPTPEAESEVIHLITPNEYLLVSVRRRKKCQGGGGWGRRKARRFFCISFHERLPFSQARHQMISGVTLWLRTHRVSLANSTGQHESLKHPGVPRRR